MKDPIVVHTLALQGYRTSPRGLVTTVTGEVVGSNPTREHPGSSVGRAPRTRSSLSRSSGRFLTTCHDRPVGGAKPLSLGYLVEAGFDPRSDLRIVLPISLFRSVPPTDLSPPVARLPRTSPLTSIIPPGRWSGGQHRSQDRPLDVSLIVSFW